MHGNFWRGRGICRGQRAPPAAPGTRAPAAAVRAGGWRCVEQMRLPGLSPAHRGPPGLPVVGACPAQRCRRRAPGSPPCCAPSPRCRRSARPGALPRSRRRRGRALPAPGARSRLPPGTKFSSRNSGGNSAEPAAALSPGAPVPGGGRHRPCHAGLPPGSGGAGGQRRPMRPGRPGGG